MFDHFVGLALTGLKPCGWSHIQVSLFLLTGGAGIVHVQGCGMHWYLTS